MSVTPAQVSAVLVTRGDVDLTEILASLEAFDEVVIWNNQLEEDLSVYGRYAGILQARNEIVYVQDDDCLVDAERLVRVAAAYALERQAVCNMPESRWADYPDSALVGWGAVFHRDLPQKAFARFDSADLLATVLSGGAPSFLDRCDNVFTVLTDCVKVDIGFQHLPWAETTGRMFTTPGHADERDRMIDLARRVRDARTAA